MYILYTDVDADVDWSASMSALCSHFSSALVCSGWSEPGRNWTGSAFHRHPSSRCGTTTSKATATFKGTQDALIFYAQYLRSDCNLWLFLRLRTVRLGDLGRIGPEFCTQVLKVQDASNKIFFLNWGIKGWVLGKTKIKFYLFFYIGEVFLSTRMSRVTPFDKEMLW